MRNPFGYLLCMIEKARHDEVNLMTPPRPVANAAKLPPKPAQPTPTLASHCDSSEITPAEGYRDVRGITLFTVATFCPIIIGKLPNHWRQA